MKYFKIIILIFFISMHAAGLQAQQKATVKSPDGKIVFSFLLNKEMPSYQVSYSGQTIVKNSELSLVFKENGSFSANLSMLKTKVESVDDRYQLVIGKTKNVHHPYRQLTIPLQERSGAGRRINIVVRAFNDGVAFRYEFPKQENWSAYT
ncbi:MAG: glycoside hydrolase family 97 protein, partial [Pedobacter sp.]